MGHPATTNPLIIMTINMTVVFIVLISLIYVIKLIHMIDPTAKKKEEAPAAPVVATPAPAPAVPAPVVEEGIPQETVAVICAALASYGFTSGQIHAIRPVYNKTWGHSARYLREQ